MGDYWLLTESGESKVIYRLLSIRKTEKLKSGNVWNGFVTDNNWGYKNETSKQVKYNMVKVFEERKCANFPAIGTKHFMLFLLLHIFLECSQAM